jgi:hypothetical protein
MYAKYIRNITLSNAKKGYNKVNKTQCNKTKPLSRIGLDTLDKYFLNLRLKTKTRVGISFYDAMKDNKIRKHLTEKVHQIYSHKKIETKEELIQHQYYVFRLYYGTVTQFRPAQALRVYCELNPKVGVLDFSCGWGGRCLAAMAMNIPYVGIDANVGLKSAYDKMIQDINSETKPTLIFQPSETVDFSRFEYDLIFTSPPYLLLEKYEHMPKYKTTNEFNDRFFKPVVMNSWKYLKTGGHLALNMPKEMYEVIQHDLPKLKKKMKMPISNRHPDIKKGMSQVKRTEKFEYIYIWQKIN